MGLCCCRGARSSSAAGACPRGLERDLCPRSLGSPSLANGTVSKSLGPTIGGVICFCSESSPPDCKLLRAPVLITLRVPVLLTLRVPVLATLTDSVLVALSS